MGSCCAPGAGCPRAPPCSSVPLSSSAGMGWLWDPRGTPTPLRGDTRSGAGEVSPGVCDRGDSTNRNPAAAGIQLSTWHCNFGVQRPPLSSLPSADPPPQGHGASPALGPRPCCHGTGQRDTLQRETEARVGTVGMSPRCCHLSHSALSPKDTLPRAAHRPCRAPGCFWRDRDSQGGFFFKAPSALSGRYLYRLLK